jgi:hypothetical protein
LQSYQRDRSIQSLLKRQRYSNRLPVLIKITSGIFRIPKRQLNGQVFLDDTAKPGTSWWRLKISKDFRSKGIKQYFFNLFLCIRVSSISLLDWRIRVSVGQGPGYQ